MWEQLLKNIKMKYFGLIQEIKLICYVSKKKLPSKKLDRTFVTFIRVELFMKQNSTQKKNKLIVQDEEKKSICKNEIKFENNENWIFVLGAYGVEIECEILEFKKW